jgi:hypothetical protein
MLHGILRGLIIGATGGCVGGPFLLPTVNYVEMAERKEKQRTDAAAEQLDEAP